MINDQPLTDAEFEEQMRRDALGDLREVALQRETQDFLRALGSLCVVLVSAALVLAVLAGGL